MKIATLFLAFLTISGVFGNNCLGGAGHVEHRSRVDMDNNMFMDRLARAMRDSISSKVHIAQLYPQLHVIRRTREIPVTFCRFYRDGLSMMEQLIQLVCQLKSRLYQLPDNELCELVNFIQKGTETGKKNKLELIKLIETLLDKVALKQADNGIGLYTCVLDEVKKMQKRQTVNQNLDTNKQSQPDQNANNDTQARTAESYTLLSQELSKYFRKEFKITGQIGLPSEKGKLSFVCVARQIENGLKKGYTEDEIVDAVVRSITPGLSVKSYLEGRDGLTLAGLRRILRGHFQEKVSRVMYDQLTMATQGRKEDAMTFLLRVLDLKQKELFASKEAHSRITYQEDALSETARQAIFTGLRCQAHRNNLQTLLAAGDATEEDIIQQLSVKC